MMEGVYIFQLELNDYQIIQEMQKYSFYFAVFLKNKMQKFVKSSP